MFCSAQERAIRTNYVKQKIDKTAQSPLFRMCHKKSETIFYIVSECEKLAQKEYKKKKWQMKRREWWWWGVGIVPKT